jgi:hypothetical protein
MTVTPASPPIKAIETEYAGCRFRSRLEARWAVFFDALGWKWRYEPQGYELPSGRYLPDFMLGALEVGIHDREIYTEVKGSLSHEDVTRLIDAALELPEVSGGRWQPRLLVLGEIPRPGTAWTHARIEVGDDMWAIRNVFFDDYFIVPLGEAVAFHRSALDRISPADSDFLRKWLTEPAEAARLTVHPKVDDAYRAARSARFEFGETPTAPSALPQMSATAVKTQTRIRRAALRRDRAYGVDDFESVLRSEFDIDTVEGRVAALRNWAPLIATTSGLQARNAQIESFAQATGLDIEAVQRAVADGPPRRRGG